MCYVVFCERKLHKKEEKEDNTGVYLHILRFFDKDSYIHKYQLRLIPSSLNNPYTFILTL